MRDRSDVDSGQTRQKRWMTTDDSGGGTGAGGQAAEEDERQIRPTDGRRT